MKKFLSTQLVFILIFTSGCQRKTSENFQFPFQDHSLPTEARVADIVQRLDLKQKVAQLGSDAPAIPVLNIPAYNWWNECLHGVARAGEATVFPQAIGLAATWNTELLYQVATTISEEARAKHHYFADLGYRDIYQGLTMWSPNINIFRDPRWGRGHETYGEDPFLTGEMAKSFITGLQGDDPDYFRVIATAKHYAVHSGPEKSRHSDNYVVSNIDLNETYLPHFEKVVHEANVQSVMCAYNRYDGEVCCGSTFLLHEKLRNEWGFNGYVVSDCGAIYDFHGEGYHEITNSAPESAALALSGGTDLNCGSIYPQYLEEAILTGLIPESALDRALSRLFTARMKLGMFDPPEKVGYTNITYETVSSAANSALALETARESIVLLKNEGNILPLNEDIESIAVIGPNRDNYLTQLGNYNGTPMKFSTVVSAIRKKLPESNILTADGARFTSGFPNYKIVPMSWFPDSLRGDYYSNPDLSGDPEMVQFQANIDFEGARMGLPLTMEKVDTFSVRWNGRLVPPASAKYTLAIRIHNQGRLYLDDSLLIQGQVVHHPRIFESKIILEGGKSYGLRFEYSNIHSDPTAQLLWDYVEQDPLNEAMAMASGADVILLCLGLTPLLEGEEMPLVYDGFDRGDRTFIELPQTQRKLMERINELGKPTILVLMNGGALALPWADENIPGIVEAWYPGQAGGQAIADVLFGDYNPGGRLPVTFYRSTDDLPDFKNYNMDQRTYKYFEGQPVYPFGHGLSYTRFEYSQLSIINNLNSNRTVQVNAMVTNTGDMEGNEVVQVYIDFDGVDGAPNRRLIGFERINLTAGESKSVGFSIPAREVSVWNENGELTLVPGTFTISLGGKQPGFSGNADALTTRVVSGMLIID